MSVKRVWLRDHGCCMLERIGMDKRKKLNDLNNRNKAKKKKKKENVRREHKDRLFVKLFGDPENKRSLMSLYNALNNRNCTDPDEIEINTIEDVIYMGRKNDVSCIVDGHMNLFEHQSTYNPNMPLRGSIYIAKLYEKYIEQHGLNIYSERLEKIPTPRYFILYNGEKDMPERLELKLSDAFMHPDENVGIEFTATMLNINYGHNEELMEACRTLKEYSIFVDKVRRHVKAGKGSDKLSKAVDTAVDECIKEGVLAEFLSAHKAEVKNMILTEYNEEKTKELLKKEYWNEGHSVGKLEGRLEGHREGIREGKLEGQREEKYMIAVRLKSMGMPDEKLAKALDITQEELKEILDSDVVHEEGEEYNAR